MAISTPTDIGELVVSTPGVYGGRPCLAGTRMPVRQIAVMHLEGLSPGDILAEFPHLDLARVYAALAYYYRHRAEIDADLETDASLYDELRTRHPRGWPPRPQ